MKESAKRMRYRQRQSSRRAQYLRSRAEGASYGGASRQLGHVLNGLSTVASSEGNYEQAVEFARQADDVYHRLATLRERHTRLTAKDC